MPRVDATTKHGNLPVPLSSFVGRRREMAEVRQLLHTERLVTLTGAGGSGKTRLALQVAHMARESYEDGAWLVELAPLADEALIAQTAAGVLGISEQAGRPLLETLMEHLEERQTLLLLDNCEHLIQASAEFVKAMLEACPTLTILATSREPLGVPGEMIRIIPPLSLPASPASVADSEAVQLFIARAQAAAPGFNLTDEHTAAAASICRSLDGMPLAIELAAARLRSLSIEEVRERLADRFKLLTGGSRTAPARQRTLEATLDWSYGLLSDSEKSALQGLSVFAGGATLEAAQFVCADGSGASGDIVDDLARLVDKNLVLAGPSDFGGTRYRQLETIRQYASARLNASGGLPAARDRHLDHFVRWVELAEPHLAVIESPLWLNRFEEEHDNLRAALEWSLTDARRSEDGLRLAAVTAVFWERHGHHHEGRRRLQAILAAPGAQPATLPRATALFHASNLAFYQSDYDVASRFAHEALEACRQIAPLGKEVAADVTEMLAEVAAETGNYPLAEKRYRESLALAREANYLKGIGEDLKMLGWLTMRTGTLDEARPMMEEALEICRRSGNLHQVTSALAGLGELAIRQREYKRAEDYLNEALRLARSLGEKWALGIVLGSQGWLALRRNHFKETHRLLGESLAIRMESGDRGGTAWCLEKLAEACQLRGRFRSATSIFAAASALRKQSNAVADAADQPDHERLLSAAQTALAESEYAAAWAEGENLPLARAVEFALQEAALAADEHDDRATGTTGLTAREREVVELIAQGKSNRQIAEVMTVGVKTVETYVTRILGKLGLQSRVQVATWTIQKHPERLTKGHRLTGASKRG